MLFQVLCGFEPIFYTTHPNEESYVAKGEVVVIEESFGVRITEIVNSKINTGKTK